ncbi:MAG: hypothetical protein AB2L11_03805 [Syntrophobacteraceae bacterium]
MRPSLKKTISLILLPIFIGIFLLAGIKMLRREEPYYSWFYCFAWWTYILSCESYLFYRGGESKLFREPGVFLVWLPLSITSWLVFEAFNFRLQNWHYINVPSQTALRWLGYTVSFSTVLPGIIVTKRLLEHFGILEGKRTVGYVPACRALDPFMPLGLAALVLPLLWPAYFFPLVWVGFIFLIDPVNFRFGAKSFIVDWLSGYRREVYLILLAGFFCGLFWEIWNFWAGSKWIYTLPYASRPKLFEMPLLGFLGFPAFALECYVFLNCFNLLRNQIRQAKTPRMRKVRWASVMMLVFFFDLLVYIGIDRFTVLSFRN